jgi:PAS domain S-box-containing protein
MNLAALARDTLLHHLARGDARHALRVLVATLTQQGLPCRLVALDATGTERWHEGLPPATPAAPPRALRVDHLGRLVGRLEHPAAAPLALDELLPTIGSLLRADEEAASTTRGTSAALVRAALAGADTFVWEWDIDSDRLGDLDEGLALLGFSAHERGVTQEDWSRLIHPADVLANEDAYQRHARGETDFYEHAYRVRHANGQWRWMLERGRVIERHADGRPRRMVGTQTDITERRAVEEAASEATARLTRIARHAPGVLYQFELAADRSTRFSYMSDRIRDLFGIEPEQALADADAVFGRIDHEGRAAVRASVMASAASLGEWRCEFRIRRTDGAERWILGMSTPERLPDGRTVWHGYMEDVTERRELEQARRDTLVAEAANRAKTQFLGRMSHELRTPLNAVLGFAQLMEIDRAEPPSPGQARRLKLIREAGEHLLRMISDMLDLTRVESGGMTLNVEPVVLRPLAEQALEMVAETAAKAQVQLELAPGGETLTLHADRARLRQVLFNLLSNAIKYNRPGGRVEVAVQAGGDGQALIIVRDNGQGIAEAALAHIFEPFHRAGQERGPVEGAGIGLAVTKAIVELMQGHIEVASRAGEGSTFSVRLPLAAEAAGS